MAYGAIVDFKYIHSSQIYSFVIIRTRNWGFECQLATVSTTAPPSTLLKRFTTPEAWLEHGPTPHEKRPNAGSEVGQRPGRRPTSEPALVQHSSLRHERCKFMERPLPEICAEDMLDWAKKDVTLGSPASFTVGAMRSKMQLLFT